MKNIFNLQEKLQQNKNKNYLNNSTNNLQNRSKSKSVKSFRYIKQTQQKIVLNPATTRAYNRFPVNLKLKHIKYSKR